MMNNFIGLDTRNRRNLNTTFPPIHVPVSNYSTKTQTKENMNDTYNTMFLNNLNLIPDPLKKNLADSVITDKDINMTKTKEFMPKEVEKPPSSQTSDFYPKLRNIISGVINVMGAMFQWRDSSPASQYYDCFEGDYVENSDEPMSGSVPWQSANCDVQNKNGWAQSIFDDNNETNWNSEMMSNCSPALTDDQINQVCLLLNGDSNYIQIPNSKSKPFESGSVDVFEDAFCPDQLSLSGESYLEYHSPYCYQEELFNSYASNLKSKLNTEIINSKESKDMTPKHNSDGDILSESVEEMPKQDNILLTNTIPEITLIPNKCDIVRNLERDKGLSPRTSPQPINEIIEKPALVIEPLSSSELNEELTKPDMPREDSPKSDKIEIVSAIKENVVSSCEDKLKRLKALLKPKCSRKIENSVNTEINNTSENIVCDTVFGDEISIPSTACLRLAEPFDEVTGKFYSSSVESDDSFQIVFTDDVKASRCRIPSECESEDSFIVFEESPDSCYISDDVFGNVQINHYSDSDTSDSEYDSGCESRLCPGFSRTVEDLTDYKLYDEVDSSTVIGQHYNHSVTPTSQNEDKKTSKDVPRKKVHFSTDPPKVHVMRVWAYAARQARIGEWEQHARDRERFKSRINDVEMAISWVLKPQHRKLVMFQRFMPWWNAQKRKELEEKKQRELEQQMKQQEEQKVESTEELNNNDEETDKVPDNNTTEQQLQERLQEETQNNDTEIKEKVVNNEIESKYLNPEKSIPEEAQVEENRKLDIKEKKAPDRANSQEAELDNNFQFGHELQTKNPCDDVSDDSAPAAPASESDR
ncbi:uncharacterized protein LOC121726871 [Aricia agestis]|uniref:uncharacterized protein LOC121726871 n=1 Tax=Aricia agestis TaxID=91739 RepID=UPI001C207EFE|nr:uncharacterized protein LOC121726871 [Aricia agestis]